MPQNKNNRSIPPPPGDTSAIKKTPLPQTKPIPPHKKRELCVPSWIAIEVLGYNFSEYQLWENLYAVALTFVLHLHEDRVQFSSFPRPYHVRPHMNSTFGVIFVLPFKVRPRTDNIRLLFSMCYFQFQTKDEKYILDERKKDVFISRGCFLVEVGFYLYIFSMQRYTKRKYLNIMFGLLSFFFFFSFRGLLMEW